MNKKYIVRLTRDERVRLKTLVKTGKAAAYKRQHAQILLKADVGDSGPGWVDQEISDAFNVSIRCVERLRKRLVEQGLDAAIERAKRSRDHRKFTGEHEAHLIALACGKPPLGQTRWTLRLLAKTMVRLEHADSMSYETVRRVLKKRNKTVAKERMVHSP